MSKCELLSEYEKNLRKYLRHKHQTTSDRSERDRKGKIKRFLKFCCKRGLKRISEIKQIDYDRFMQLNLASYSTETRRKYRLALREFFNRAKLNVRVNPAKATRVEKEKKFEKLKSILKDCNIEQYRDEIMNLF